MMILSAEDDGKQGAKPPTESLPNVSDRSEQIKTFAFPPSKTTGILRKLLDERESLLKLEAVALQSGDRDLVLNWGKRISGVDERISRVSNTFTVTPVHKQQSDSAAREITQQWYQLMEWSFVANPSPAMNEFYTKALAQCCRGDGVLSDEERAFVIGYMTTWTGENDEGAADIARHVDFAEKADIEKYKKIIQEEGHPVDGVMRAVVYDCIRACSADSKYVAGEKEAVRHFAKDAGLSDDFVTAMEEIVVERETLRVKAMEMIYPSKQISFMQN